MHDAPVEPRVTKHRQIVDFLRSSITEGGYSAGDQLPTEEELVRKFAASRPTVSKAMKALSDEGLIERRAGSGTFVKWMKPVAGKMLGLLIPGLGSTEIFEPICAQLSGVAQENGFSLVWGSSTPVNGATPLEQAEALCAQYIEQKVAGVFFAPIEMHADMDETNRRIAERFQEAGIAVVLLDRDLLPYPVRSQFDLVSIDNRRAGYGLTEHLFAAGCAEVHFLGHPFSAPTVDARLAGYQEALLANGVIPKASLVHRMEPDDGTLIKKLMRKSERMGVLCANDATAVRFMQELHKAGVDVPGKVCVAGIDDVKYAQLLRVPLTSWHQPCKAIGNAAFAAMHERLQHADRPGREILLNGALVARQSTRPTN